MTFHVANPFPVSEHLLCCFTAYLADQHLAPQTISSYLAAVRNMHFSLGLPDPRDSSSLLILKRVQAGIRRTRLQGASQPRICLPITARVLGKLKEALDKSTHPQRILLWAVACSAFFGFFRLGELLPEKATPGNPATSLTWGDVTIDDAAAPTMVKVHLKKAKCDQFGKGADIIMGRTYKDLCPVVAVVSFMVYRSSKPGPFFTNEESKVLTKAKFVREIRDILKAIGMPQDQYAGHSFRIGAATSAAQAGIADSTIQTLGRWQSTAFLQYIRMPKESLAAVSLTLQGRSKLILFGPARKWVWLKDHSEELRKTGFFFPNDLLGKLIALG